MMNSERYKDVFTKKVTPEITRKFTEGLCILRLDVAQCSSTFLSAWNPRYAFAFVMEPPLTNLKKHELLARKSNYSLLDTLQKLKIKKFNDLVVLAFLKWICYIQNLAKRTPISNMCRPIF